MPKKIGGVKMDGSESRILVKTDLLTPLNMFYHAKTRKLYWTDSGRHKIECVSVDDAENSRVQILADGLDSPTGLAIWDAVSGADQESAVSILYYADQVQEVLMALNLKTGEKNVIRNNVPFIEQIKLFQRPQFTQDSGVVTNPCLTNNGGCQQICLPSRKASSGRVCRCSNGLQLQPQDNNTCKPYKSFVFVGTATSMRALPLLDDQSINQE